MKQTVKVFWKIFFFGFAGFAMLLLLINFGLFGKLPSLSELENPSILQATEVYAADGTLMGKYFRERGNRSNVDYNDISKHVINALVATEDERFYEHSGIDGNDPFLKFLDNPCNGICCAFIKHIEGQLLGDGRATPFGS